MEGQQFRKSCFLLQLRRFSMENTKKTGQITSNLTTICIVGGQRPSWGLNRPCPFHKLFTRCQVKFEVGTKGWNFTRRFDRLQYGSAFDLDFEFISIFGYNSYQKTKNIPNFLTPSKFQRGSVWNIILFFVSSDFRFFFNLSSSCYIQIIFNLNPSKWLIYICFFRHVTILKLCGVNKSNNIAIYSDTCADKEIEKKYHQQKLWKFFCVFVD
jgi:hypothetical protein